MSRFVSRLALGLWAAALLSSPRAAHASDWVLDASALKGVTAKVSPITVYFEKVSGRIHMDDIDPDRSTFEFVLDAASLRRERDGVTSYLQSPEFFDVARTPTITLKTTKLEKVGKNRFRATADLTLRGVTRSVSCELHAPMPVRKDATGRLTRAVSIWLSTSRKVWGLGGGDAAVAEVIEVIELTGRPLADTLVFKIKASFLLANPSGEVAAPVPAPPAK